VDTINKHKRRPARLSGLLTLVLVLAGVQGAPSESASAAGSTSQTITVTSAPSIVAALDTFEVSATSTSGLPVSVSVTGVPAGACTISGSLVSTPLAGVCYVYFNQAGDADYAAASQVVVLVGVTSRPATITAVNPGSMTLTDSPRQVQASASSGLPTLFSTISVPGSPSTCSISSSGLVTPISVGACTIQVRSNGTYTYAPANNVNLSFQITKASQSTFSIISPSRIEPSGQATIQVTGGSGAGAVTLSAAGDCAVSGFVVTASSSGSTCTITATKAADSTYTVATATQTVSISYGPAPVTPPTPTDSGDIVVVLDEVATKLLKPSLEATDVWNTSGGKLVFTGRNLLSIQKIFVGENLAVKLIEATDSRMTIEVPKASLVGWQPLKLQLVGGTKTLDKIVRYQAPIPVVLKPVTKVLKGFKTNQKALSKPQMIALKKYVRSVGKYKSVNCRGTSATIYMTCKYLKKIYKAGRVKVTKLKIKATSPAAKQVRIIFSR
jgi:hypothetical protein